MLSGVSRSAVPRCSSWRPTLGSRSATTNDLVILPEVLTWLGEAVTESDLNEHAARERNLKKIEEQRRRITSKLETMYEDKLEGRISAEFFDRKAAELKVQETELLRQVNDIRAAEPAPVQHALNLMDLTSRTAALFKDQPVHERQRFLRLVLKTASWKGGELQTQFEEPFETLRRSNQLSQTKGNEMGVESGDFQEWLPGMDSNHDNRKLRGICKLQRIQWSKRPDWTRKTSTRTQLVHGRPSPVTAAPMSDCGRSWGSGHQAKSPWRSGSFRGNVSCSTC